MEYKSVKNLEDKAKEESISKYSTFSEQFLEKPEVVGEYALNMGGTMPWFIPTFCTVAKVWVIDDVDTFD